jgi:hypothetical protein
MDQTMVETIRTHIAQRPLATDLRYVAIPVRYIKRWRSAMNKALFSMSCLTRL